MVLPDSKSGSRWKGCPILAVKCFLWGSSYTFLTHNFFGFCRKILEFFLGTLWNSGFTCSGLDSLLSRSLYRQAPLTLAASSSPDHSSEPGKGHLEITHFNVKSLNFSRSKNPTVDGIEKQSGALASARWRSWVWKKTVVVLLKPCKLEQWHLLKNHWVRREGKVGLKSATLWKEAAHQQPAPFAFQIAGPHSYELRLPPLHFFWVAQKVEGERLMRTAAPSLWQNSRNKNFYMYVHCSIS